MVLGIVTQCQPFLFQAVSAVALVEWSFWRIAHDCAVMLNHCADMLGALCVIVLSIVRECCGERR